MAGLGSTVAALKRLKPLIVMPDALRAGGAPGGRMHETLAFGDNPGNLRMLSFAPDGARALVVVLHGCTQTAEGYAAGAGWLTLAERHGFAVLAPEQAGANNPNRCFNWFLPSDVRRGEGEVASIAAMIAHAVEEHGLDARRVYVTGLSAGGAMASALLATYPELFAGGGIVAGLPYGAAISVPEAFEAMHRPRAHPDAYWGEVVRQASDHTGSWPTVSVWQGGADTTVVAANGDALVQQWRDVHGLPQAPDRVSGEPAHTVYAWTGRGRAPLVEQHILPSLAHGTPLSAMGEDGVGAAGPFLLEMGVSASLEMARSWGLAPASSRRSSAVASKTAPRSATVDATFSTPEPHRFDVAGVINRALAAAGLLK